MNDLKHLFLDGLAEIYDTEVRLVGSMPHLAFAATCPHLKTAIQTHLRETQRHLVSIESIFRSLGERVRRRTSEAIIAFLNENNAVLSNFKGFPVLNAALIAALQKIEHYEIASYGCLRDWAELLGKEQAAGMLQEILSEDKATNQALTDLARALSNHEALVETTAELPFLSLGNV